MYIIKLINQYYYSLRHDNLYKNVTSLYKKSIKYCVSGLCSNINNEYFISLAQYRSRNNYFYNSIHQFINKYLSTELRFNCFVSLDRNREVIRLPFNYHFTYRTKKELALYLSEWPDNKYYESVSLLFFHN